VRLRGSGGGADADEVDLSLPSVPTRAQYAGKEILDVRGMGKEEKLGS